MSLITELFGRHVLNIEKSEAIIWIQSSPLIRKSEKTKYLRDWAAGTGNTLTAADFEQVKEPWTLS